MRPDVAGMLIDGKGDAPAERPGPIALVITGDRAIAGDANDGGSCRTNRLASPFIFPKSPMKARPSRRVAKFHS